MDDRAVQIIDLRNRERSKQMVWFPQWQDAADLCYPREDQIISKTAPGEDKSLKRIDSTGVEASKLMASGLAASLNITTGQRFFGLKAINPAFSENDEIRRWLWGATELLHIGLYASNIILHLIQSFRSLVVFGTSCLYSEWDLIGDQLNFKDHAISTYCIKENSHGDVDTVILSYILTARQAVQEFDNACSEEIRKDVEKFETESRPYNFVRIVRPRTERNPLYRDNQNMPFECVDVDEKAKTVVAEHGYKEFPYHVGRWEKGATEKYGRGPGTDYLADLRLLQKIAKDFIDICNKKGVPPLEVLDSFEGEPNLIPGSSNRVLQMDSIRPINLSATGELQVVWQALQEQRKVIRDYFYESVFTPITRLEGTHRTALEIDQRRQEGLRLLAAPVMNTQSEKITPLIMRCAMLMIRHGKIPLPPPELLKVTGRSRTSLEVEVDAKQLGIEYIGPLALALSNQEAQGSEGLVNVLAQLNQVDPSLAVMDYINWDNTILRWAQARGVNVGDIASAEEIAAKRQARQQAAMMQQAAQAAEVASNAYAKTSKKAEEGSAAEQVMAGMNQ
jgi:hypothetical protein